MGDLRSAIADDEEEYERLCRKYGEKPQTRRGGRNGELFTDCYGKHAEELKERSRQENKKEICDRCGCGHSTWSCPLNGI